MEIGIAAVNLLAVKISKSCILSIEFYAGSKFCVINTTASPEEFYLNCKTLQVSNIVTFTDLQMNYVFTALFDFREIKHNLL